MADKTLIMYFMNEQGKRISIKLTGVKDTLVQTDVSSAMDMIIAKNIFSSTGGDLKTKDSAELTSRSVEVITVK